MRRLLAAVLFAAALPFATRCAAQGPPADSTGMPVGPDSGRVTTLEEQAVGPGDGEEADRGEVDRGEVDRDGADRDEPDSERPAGRSGRRAAGWRASLTIRSGALLQEAAGYSRGTYTGDRAKLFQKLAVRGAGWFSAEVLTDKDPGEPPAADFVSAALSASLFAGGVRLVAGDFRMRSGQGLLFGSARPIGKGAAVIEPVVRSSWGLPDGVSSDEARFFRGAAMEARAGPLRVVAFGSNRTVTPLLTGDGAPRGIDASGYHRTADEIARKGRLAERSAGGGVRLSVGDRLSLGGALLATSFRMADGDGPAGEGRIDPIRRWSIDLRARAGDVTIFGEGLPAGAQTAWIAGALFGGPAGRVVIVRRYYPPADGLRGTSGFADTPGGSNEEGTYIGAEAAVVPGLTLSAFLDVYSGIGPAQGSVHPPAGVDRLVCLRFEPDRRCGAEIRFRSTAGEEGTAAAGPGPLSVPGNAARRVRRVRAEVRWHPGAGASCLLRLDHCTAVTGEGGAESGALLTAGFAWEAWRALTIDATARFFRTGSFDSGIPAVDVDIPGTLASTIYSGEGSAWTAGWSWNGRTPWPGRVRLSFRYSILRRDDLRHIGTGPARLPSNLREKAGIEVEISY